MEGHWAKIRLLFFAQELFQMFAFHQTFSK